MSLRGSTPRIFTIFGKMAREMTAFTFVHIILHMFLIIIMIIRCQDQDVPGCSVMFHIPGFIDDQLYTHLFENQQTSLD